MSTLSAILAGLGSAVCFGGASAGQHSVASAGESKVALDPRLLGTLARSRTWLLAGVLELTAVALQVLALRWGAVSLVQPLLVLGLPLAVLISARLKEHRIGAAEWAGIALCAVGVAVVAALLPGVAAQRGDTPLRALLELGAVLAAAALAGAVVPHRVVAGIAAGVAAGVGAAALALSGHLLTQPLTLLTDWPPYLAAAAGLLALQLGQAAFQEERLGAPLTALTLAEPLTAIALSALVLHERLTTGALPQAVCLLAALAATVGVAMVVRYQPA